MGLLTVMDLLYPIEFVPHHWQTREKERNRFVKIWDALFTVKISLTTFKFLSYDIEIK